MEEGCWCQKVTDDPLSEPDANGSITENLQVILGQLASTIEANEFHIHFFLPRMNEIIRLVKNAVKKILSTYYNVCNSGTTKN